MKLLQSRCFKFSIWRTSNASASVATAAAALDVAAAAGREIYRFLFGRPKLLPATLVVLASSIHINTSFRKRRLAQVSVS